jgi:hypothetical protein
MESSDAQYSWVWYFKTLLNVINIFNAIIEITIWEILNTFSPFLAFRCISENKFSRYFFTVEAHSHRSRYLVK